MPSNFGFKSSFLLEESLQFLWNGIVYCYEGKDQYICLAIGEVFRKHTGWYRSPDQVQICCDIQEMLGRGNTVESWLRRVARIPDKQLTDKAVQAYRKRWVKHLVKEYKKKGD